MRKYTSLFLDLDNTLLDFEKAEKYAVQYVLKQNGLPHDDDTAALYSGINQRYWERFEKGEIPKSEIFTGRFITLMQRLGANADAVSISKQYGEKLSDGFFVTDGAFAVLDALRDKGYFLYATTNGISSVQHKRITGSGLRPYFDAIFVSEDSGFQKPQKEYFTYAISKIDEQDKTKILIVGDSQSSDVLGGINAGIDVCWYNPKHLEPLYPSRYEIDSLDQLLTLL